MSKENYPGKAEREAFAGKLREFADKRYHATGRNYAKLTADIVKACDVSAPEGYGWITGHNLPPEAKMEALLGVVFQKDGWVTEPMFLKAAGEVHTLYQAAQNAQGDIEIPPLTDADMPEIPASKPKASPRQKGGGGGHHHGRLIVYDAPGMPPRLHQDSNSKYEQLDKERLLDIQKNTEHFPEFLHVSRLIQQWPSPNRRAFAKGLKDSGKEEFQTFSDGASLLAFEIGNKSDFTVLPLAARRDALLETYFPNDTDMQNHGKYLHRRNTAQLAYASTSNKQARDNYAEPEYFTEKLQRHHIQQGLPRTVDEPKWAKGIELAEINNKQAYLNHAMHASETSEQLLAKQTGYSEWTVSVSLRTTHNTLDFYTKAGDWMQAHPKHGTLFHRSVYDALPYRETGKYADMVKRGSIEPNRPVRC